MWKKIRAMLVFQLKLGLDAVRDLILSPVGTVCFILDLLLNHDGKPGYFHRLMVFGRKTDSWIGLFSSHHDSVELYHGEQLNPEHPENVDKVIGSLLRKHDDNFK